MPLIKSPPCPECSSRLNRVMMSRRLDDGAIVRRRVCEVCDHRWYSQQAAEVVVPSHQLFWGTTRSPKVLTL
jgi:hypothetical protein